MLEQRYFGKYIREQRGLREVVMAYDGLTLAV
jgi:hypothetical protein